MKFKYKIVLYYPLTEPISSICKRRVVNKMHLLRTNYKEYFQENYTKKIAAIYDLCLK